MKLGKKRRIITKNREESHEGDTKWMFLCRFHCHVILCLSQGRVWRFPKLCSQWINGCKILWQRRRTDSKWLVDKITCTLEAMYLGRREGDAFVETEERGDKMNVFRHETQRRQWIRTTDIALHEFAFNVCTDSCHKLKHVWSQIAFSRNVLEIHLFMNVCHWITL